MLASDIPEMVFQPKYTLKFWVSALGVAAMIPVLIAVIWSLREVEPAFMLLGFLALGIVLARLQFRRIEFYHNKFVVIYFLGNKKSIAYREIQDIGMAIKTGKGNIGLLHVRNSDELVETLMNHVLPNQLSGDMLESQFNLMRAILWGLPGLPIVWVMLDYAGVSGRHFGELVVAVWGVLVAATGYLIERIRRNRPA